MLSTTMAELIVCAGVANLPKVCTARIPCQVLVSNFIMPALLQLTVLMLVRSPAAASVLLSLAAQPAMQAGTNCCTCCAGQSQHQCCHHPHGRRLWLELHSLGPCAVQLLLWVHDDTDPRRLHHLQAGRPHSFAIWRWPVVSCHCSSPCHGRHHARCADTYTYCIAAMCCACSCVRAHYAARTLRNTSAA